MFDRFLKTLLLSAGIAFYVLHPADVYGQQKEKKESVLKRDSLYISADSTYANTMGGEFIASRGFDVFRSKEASLNISIYGLARSINQLPATQSFVDHLGRERAVDTRRDIQWHRTFIWLSGHFLTPKLRYTVNAWGLASTQQTLVFGNLQYQLNKHFNFGVGVGPNYGIRSLGLIWPFFHASDRQMVEEFIRPGFTGSLWMNGEALPKVKYAVAIGNNLSQLGISSANLTRNLSKSATVWWMPTTGEFGPRNGNNDFEEHQQFATRFGASFTANRENRSNQVTNPDPLSTQIRLSDGVLLFETGALAEGVTVIEADYLIVAADAGFKYKGWHLQTEVFYRRLSDFYTDQPLELASVIDKGFNASLSYPVISKRLVMYAASGMVFDDFKRQPWEIAGGMNYYPSGTRTLRLNLHVIHMEKSPASSQFGYYIAGQSGTTFSLGVDFLL